MRHMYATGLEHGNNQIGYTMLSVIFLREHNRICDELTAIYQGQDGWDADRLFETTRSIMIVLLLNIVLNEYVAQVGVVKFPFAAEIGWAETKPWYRNNWINVEFSLLYRWHSMVPDVLQVGDRALTAQEFRMNPQLIQELGVGAIVAAASQQTAGRIGLGNTHDMFLDPMPPKSGNASIQETTLQIARDAKLQPLNAYRKQFGLPEITDFAQLVGDDHKQGERFRKAHCV